MKPLRRLALLSLLVLATTACEMRSWLDIDLSDPEAGVVEISVGFDEQLRDLMAESGGGEDLFDDFEVEASGQGWSVTSFVDEDVEGVTLTRTFASLGELVDALAQARSLGGEAEGPTLEGVSITDSGDTIRFEGSVPGAEDAEFEGMAIEELMGLLEVDARVSVTFPGEVIEHNGELVDRTVTWQLFEEDLSAVEMFAEARKGGGIPGILLGALALALLVAGVVAYRLLSDRREAIPAEQPELAAAELSPAGESLGEPGLEQGSE